VKEKIIAKRYAEAFLGYAGDSIGIEKAAEELEALKGIFSTNPDFQKFLENLNVIYIEKCTVIDAVLKDFSEETRVFIKLLLEAGRIKSFTAIADYVRINHSKGKEAEALLKTARPLDPDLIQAIKEKLELKFEKKINLRVEFDADLIAGAQVTLGNTVIDGTVRRRLDELKEKLTAVRVN
jgi:F-type H+-transporting ATPase subunit delta